MIIERVIQQTDTSTNSCTVIILVLWTIWLVPEIVGAVNTYLNPTDISAITETINPEDITNTIASYTNPQSITSTVTVNTATVTNNVVLAIDNANIEEVTNPMLNANIYNSIDLSTGNLVVRMEMDNSADASVIFYPFVDENLRDIETYNLIISSSVPYSNGEYRLAIHNIPQNLDELRFRINQSIDKAVRLEQAFEQATRTANFLDMGWNEGERFQMPYLERWKARVRVLRHLEQILRLYDPAYQSIYEQTLVED